MDGLMDFLSVYELQIPSYNDHHQWYCSHKSLLKFVSASWTTVWQLQHIQLCLSLCSPPPSDAHLVAHRARRYVR